MTGRVEVLVLGHDARRTGAPIALLEVVRWLAADPSLVVRVTLAAGGPLAERFAATVPTVVMPRTLADAARLLDGPSTSSGGPPAPTTSPPRPTDDTSVADETALDRGAGGSQGHREATTGGRSAQLLSRAVRRAGTRAPRRPRPDVVLANSLASWPAAEVASRGAPVVCWVHELDGVADRLVPPPRRAAVIAGTDRFVATGPRVAEMLVGRWGVPADRVTTVAAPVSAGPPGPHQRAVRAVDRPVVLAVGSAVARKGLDAFVATAAVVARRRPDATFRWIGVEDGPILDEARFDVAAAGLDDRVEFLPPTDDLEPAWAEATVLLHPAREDPDPMVVVEAVRHGVGVVTWDTGGAAALLRAARLGDLVAEAGDVLGLARRVLALIDDPVLAGSAAEMASRATAEHRVEVTGPAIRAVLDEAIGSRR